MRVCTPAFFCVANWTSAPRIRARTQLIHQLDEAFIVTPANTGGTQASHLIVGRHRPVGVDPSRISIEEHVAGEVRLCTLEHSEGPDEAPPSSVPGQHVVSRADHEGRCVPNLSRSAVTVGATTRVNEPSRRTQHRTFADHGQHRELSVLVVVEAKRVGEGGNHAR